jgi:hypothetical protein
MNGRRVTGAALAFAAASVFAMLPAIGSRAAETGVHCYGINGCKGQNDCKTDKNACKGQGSCKGQGFLEKKSAEECTAAGGKVGK